MHHHEHDHNHIDLTREGNKKGLLISLYITAGIMLLEFFGGIITNSLALLSDSGHMLSDTSSLALSLLAINFATRKPPSNKTYGLYRFEILAALLNGLTLFLISIFIFIEAYKRLVNPTEVIGSTMMIIAAIGLVSNLVSAWFLMKNGDIKDNVNVKSAYLHILGDAISSIGAIIAGLLILKFQWYIADPIISIFVGIIILKGSFKVIKPTVHILMEGSPQNINLTKIISELGSIKGVRNVHDLHVWTISSGFDCLSCHMLINQDEDSQLILEKAIKRLEDDFNIQHATIQIEKRQMQHIKFVNN